MSFVLKLRKKKDKEKPKLGFEDAIKAKARLNLLETRYELIKALTAENPNAKNGDDKELDSSKMAKLITVATQGFGEVGDKARPSNEAVEGYQELLEMCMLDELDYGKGNEIDKVNATLLAGASANLFNRSIRREHTNTEIVTIPPEMFMPGYMQRRGTVETLE